MKRVRKLTCVLVAALLLIMVTPIQAIANEASGIALLRLMKDQRAAVDVDLMQLDSELFEAGLSAGEIVDALIKNVKGSELVQSVYRENDKVFGYTLESGLTCVYDYSLIHSEEEPQEYDLSGLIENPEEEKVYHFTSDDLDVVVYNPYYGISGGAGDEYTTIVGPILAGSTGGTLTTFLGDDCEISDVLAMGEYGVIILQTPGVFYEGRGYVALHNENGVAASDYTNNYAVGLVGGGVAFNGSYFYNYLQSESIPDSFLHMTASYCFAEGSLPHSFINAGARAVYGYTDLITTSYDLLMAVEIYNSLRGLGIGVEYRYNIGQAIEYAKSICGEYDPRTYQNNQIYSYPRYTGEGRWYLPPANFSLSHLYISQTYVEMDVPGETTQITITPIHILSECIYQFQTVSLGVISAEIVDDGFSKIITVTALQTGVGEIHITVTDKFYDVPPIEAVIYVSVGVSELDSALNNENGNIRFFTSQHSPWVVDNESFEGRSAGKSSNTQHSSYSWIRCQLDVVDGQMLSFDWAVESERNFDNLKLYVNGQLIETIYSDVSGQLRDWERIYCRFESAGTYLIEWRYEKDSSVSQGRDCGWVDNVSLHTPPEICTVAFVDGVTNAVLGMTQIAYLGYVLPSMYPTPPEHQGYTFTGWDYNGRPITEDTTITACYELLGQLGDVDGDGVISTLDALMVIRYTLSLISLTELQIDYADTNGDNNVTTIDALAILRMSLSLG